MIATKQTKLTPPNKIIQEKPIKNTTKQAAVEEKSANCCAILSKPTTNNINTATATATTTTTTPTTNTIIGTPRDGNHHNYNHHKQQRPNETRSETKTMERNAQALAAGNPSAIKSSSVAVATATTATATAASLLTTSTKIQQRQQKFLAAAAKSATSTQRSNHPQSALSRSSVPNTNGARNTMASSTTAALKDGTKGESYAACDKVSDGISNAASDFSERLRQPQERATATTASAGGSADDHQSELISCVSVASKAGRAPTETSASEINSGVICQGQSARKSSDDTSDNGSEYRQYQQSSLNHQHHNHRHHHQQQQPEVRRSGEGKEDIDDNINIKNNTIKQHNNHNYYHHYYNHNYQNFHQHNYPHLQYQLAQITTTTTQNQLAQPQQQHVMAHYKFHNDCQSSVLTYEQVKRLDFVMDQVVPIHGRGNTPTLFVKLKELIRLVKYKLQNEHSIEIRDVRLNGGAASYVLAPENSHYNDLDLIFGTDLSNEDRFDVIRDVVLECLMEFYPREHNAQKQKQCQQEGLPINCEHLYKLSVSHNNDARTIDDDAQSQQSSRSNRSSSFESDNLNITTNESDDESEGDDDDDGNIVVRIDNNDIEGKDNKDNHSDIQGSIKPNSYETNIEALDHLRSNDDKDAKSSEAYAVSVGDNVKKQSDQLTYPQHTIQYQHIQMPPSNCAIKEAYVHKMVKVNDDDRWSLISLGVQQSETNNYNQLHQQQQASSSYSQTANPAHVVDGSMCYNGSTTKTSGTTSCRSNKGHYNNQLRQSPNSIELKFVDRMRRKFEFSVDSFQIILDSLIQFYDYAPQSTITIQRKLADVHPSSTMINTHPTACRRSCGQCCDEPRRVMNCTSSDHEGENSNCAPQQETFNNKTKVINDFLDNEKKRGRHHHKNCKASLTSPRSYYELQLDQSNSLSNSSVASSSGCSSSSSVVSSSSSSLSCDEDQEDLYCDVDSSPSSSASTSSLLSTTTVSVLSPNGNPCGLAEHQDQSKKANAENNLDLQVGQNSKQTEKQASKTSSIDCDRSFEKLRLKQEARKQCKIDASDLFRENLCDFGTGKLSSCAVISENFYPTVIGRSEYGNFKEALYHLEKKLIATRSPEEIRGGGLLKYCNLLVKNYKPTNVYQIRTLERYMCSRFFIDFSDLNQQRAKLESYLANHFSDDPMQKFDYLTILHNVVQRSTVCLMNHELRLTLNMIRDLAYELNEQQQKQQHQGQQGKPLSMAKAVQQRVAPIHQQSSSNQPSRQHDELQQHQYQQQKPVVLQSGAYRVKLVNYALAKSA